MHKRILLKLSGEQLAGNQDGGIDAQFVGFLADEINKSVEQNAQIAIIVGGGNWLRGATYAQNGLHRANADAMGMLATLMNGIALMDMLEAKGCPARLMTNIRVDQVAEPFIRRRAVRHMEKGRVVIIAGGTGKPYVTTDTAAVSTGLELDCDVVLKATKVDGVYSADPKTNPSAKRLQTVSFQDVLANDAIKIMDKAAIGLAMEQNIPITVFNLETAGNLQKVIAGGQIGSTIS